MANIPIRALDVGGHTKSLAFFGNENGELWFADKTSGKIPTVASPHNVPAADFIPFLENKLQKAGLLELPGKYLKAYSICGPVAGNICLRLINRGVQEPFEIKADSVLNDGMAATIGSKVAGMAKDHQGAVLILTLGTGVGMGSFIWSNGKLAMNDGEAHVVIKSGVKKCNCGRLGCLESAVKESALKEALISEGIPETEIGDDVGHSIVKLLDNEKVKNVLETWHKNLADGLASMYALLNLGGNDIFPPAMFVLAGGLSALINEKMLAEFILNEFGGNPLIGKNFIVKKEGVLGNRAGCVGAAALALANYLKRDILEIKFLEK